MADRDPYPQHISGVVEACRQALEDASNSAAAALHYLEILELANELIPGPDGTEARDALFYMRTVMRDMRTVRRVVEARAAQEADDD